MPEVSQICVGLEDKPGMFAKLCGTLGRARAKIVALFVSDDGGCCWVNLVADPSDVAEQALREAGYHFFTESVLTLTMRDEPDALERVAQVLADNSVNINYVYGSMGSEGASTLVLKVDDQPKAAELLEAAHA